MTRAKIWIDSNNRDKVLSNAKQLCSTICNVMELLDCVKIICMNILDDLHKGGHLHRKSETFFGAVVLVACRESNEKSCARTCIEMSNRMKVTSPEKLADDLKKIMELRPTRQIQPADLLCRFCGHLGLTYECEKDANRILTFLNSFTPSYCEGKQEARCAAIAIAHAAEMHKSRVTFQTIQHIAHCEFGVSKNTFQKDMRELKANSVIAVKFRETFPCRQAE